MQQAGGEARAAALSPEERSDIATNAAETRWGRKRDRREFCVPMDGGIAIMLLPNQMNSDDFDILIKTLALWRSRLVTVPETITCA